MKSIYKLITIPIAIFIASPIIADSTLPGKEKAETCLGCHAIPGYNNVYPTYKVPKLAGQNADYVISALKAYRNKDRDHETMHANAVALTDQDIIDLAKYFESLK
tara:strand:+ start:444 stop:758 length:315 start_codon:yes stop_codon:yes gene_type:complete